MRCVILEDSYTQCKIPVKKKTLSSCIQNSVSKLLNSTISILNDQEIDVSETVFFISLIIRSLAIKKTQYENLLMSVLRAVREYVV